MQENNIDFEKEFRKAMDKYNKSGAFSARRLIDTPTDALAVVNRKFVTLNGASANRPTSSITGQFFFDSTLGKPIWWDGSKWVKADGTAA